MTRSSSFSRFAMPGGTKRTALDAADFLRAHDPIAALLPAVARLNALQKDCTTILAELFRHCLVMHFEAEQLLISVPNAAIAARLKQKLPYLRDALMQHGWQVKTIRLKVQVAKSVEKSTPSRNMELPQQALDAFAHLQQELGRSTRNGELCAALDAMLARRSGRN